MRPRAEGFALLAVLALLAVIGLYTAATLQDALFGNVLAGTRVVQQRAFVLAELGVRTAEQGLSTTVPPADYTHELHPLADPQSSVSVVLRSTGADALPVGFSSGRFVAQRFEIQSTGHAARSARSVQVQGVLRVLPVAAAPAAP
jgi:Tfp pilus assembly protein PilX